MALNTPAGETIYINVCSALNEVPEDQNGVCVGAGACKISDGQAINLGGLQFPPDLISPGKLRLEYSPLTEISDPSCPEGTVPRTFITFTCSPGEVGVPVLELVDEQCWYFFTWATDAACSDQHIESSSCSIVDPVTLISYDLTGIPTVNLSTSSGKLYLSPCGHVGTSPCSASEGCLKDGDGLNLFIRSNLTLTNGMLSTQFFEKNDDDCTEVEVIYQCGNVTQASLVTDQLCTYSVYVVTPKACLHSDIDQCVTRDRNGVVYDLSILTKPSGAWNVSVESSVKYDFELNVCRSLSSV